MGDLNLVNPCKTNPPKRKNRPCVPLPQLLPKKSVLAGSEKEETENDIKRSPGKYALSLTYGRGKRSKKVPFYSSRRRGGVCNICIRPMSKVSSFLILVGAGAQSDLFGLDGRRESVTYLHTPRKRIYAFSLEWSREYLISLARLLGGGVSVLR